jgi:formyl-CoA transferase
MVAAYPDMESRLADAEAIDERIADWMAERTRAEVLEAFEAAEAAVGPVYNMADIFADEHFAARDALVDVGDGEETRTMRGVVPKLSETPGSVDHAGPELGAHARAVLRERAGLSDDEIDALVEDGVTALREE